MTTAKRTLKLNRPAIAMVVFAVALAGLRWLSPERPLEDLGPRALLDAFFAAGLLILVGLLAAGWGLKILRGLSAGDLSQLEKVVFSLALGFGFLSLIIFAFGLLGLLQSWILLLLLLLLFVVARHEWVEIANRLPQEWQTLRSSWRQIGIAQRSFVIGGMVILALTTLQALTPPWDYDGLMYHLQAPKLYLQAGRISILPDIWQANGPSGPDMLYLLGLSLGTDTFAKLIHLTFGVLLVLSVFAFGQRKLKPNGGWIAAAILIGIPIVPLWASWAYTDMAWAAYQFLAVYAVVLWIERGQLRWLLLAGLGMGFALDTKLLALGSAVLLEGWVLWHARSTGWKRIIKYGLIFGGIALLIASPWYLKNLFETGNPFYPLLFGGPGWDQNRLGLVMTYLQSFGTGHSLVDYLLLPIYLYTQLARFAALKGSIEIPSPLFPLAILYGFTSRPRRLDGVAFVAAGGFVWWAIGSQQTRFLLPVFPLLSLLTAAVLIAFAGRLARRRLGSILIGGLLAGLVAVTAIYSIIFFADMQPLGTIVGTESKGAFLDRVVSDYAALQFIRDNLPVQARVLMLWDGQGYYCDERCLPDPEQSRWVYLTDERPSVSAVADRLHALNVTHVLFSLGDAEFFVRHDPTGQHRRALDFFVNEFQPACTQQIYHDQWTSLFKLTC